MLVVDDPDQYEDMSEEQQETLQYWITMNFRKTKYSFNDDYTSYGLKHFFEADKSNGFYVTNGEFKGAMLAAGYKVKDLSKKNWWFNIHRNSAAFDPHKEIRP